MPNFADLADLIDSVQRNCHISDARYAGNYSMCTFLLKMREYYRWERGLPLTERLPQDQIGDWLVDRERQWETLESSDLQALPLARQTLDPFDAESVNRHLLPHGYVYSSGYGLFNKPHFFLGTLIRRERHGEASVYVSGREYARDLVAPPAMLRGAQIFVRQESVRRFVWEKIEEWQWRKQPDSPLSEALARYSAELGAEAGDMETLLDHITERETRAMILHELGEYHAGGQLSGPLGETWEDMLLALAGSRAEFIARAARDHLADATHTLPGLLQDDDQAALHFYFANFNGLRKAIFPRAWDAYQEWLSGGRLAALRDVVAAGAAHWHETTRRMLELFAARREAGSAAAIEALFPSLNS